MKIIARFAVALAVLCCTPAVHAQSADVTGGSLTITIAPALTTVLQAQGIAAIAYTPEPYSGHVAFLPATSGVFDLGSGSGVMSLGGGVFINSLTSRIKVKQLSLETVGAYPVITGSIYLNNHFIARNVIFEITSPNPLLAPMAVGPVMISNIQAILAPGFQAYLANTFNITIPANTQAATMSLNIGLTLDNF
jgi:hypothetical protein